jgi:hypothetical protein
MKTAIEWLEEQYNLGNGFERLLTNKEFEKAKEMEKKQVIDAYRDGRSDQQSERSSRFYNRSSEQHYNETFKTK